MLKRASQCMPDQDSLSQRAGQTGLNSRTTGLAISIRTTGPVTRAITIHVPLDIQHKGGRKLVLAPDGTPSIPTKPNNAPSTLLKALARAYRWQHLLESGEYGSIAELAAAEKINDSYVSRLLRLTLLGPSIVMAILDGREASELKLEEVLKPFPIEWHGQKIATESTS